MKIIRDVVWPGKRAGNGKWDDLKLEILEMPIGNSIQIDLETYQEVDDARKAAQKYAHETLLSRKDGWEIQTSKRGRALFLLKRPI